MRSTDGAIMAVCCLVGRERLEDREQYGKAIEEANRVYNLFKDQIGQTLREIPGVFLLGHLIHAGGGVFAQPLKAFPQQPLVVVANRGVLACVACRQDPRRAVQRNQRRVLVGRDAWVADKLVRLLGSWYQPLVMARARRLAGAPD